MGNYKIRCVNVSEFDFTHTHLAMTNKWKRNIFNNLLELNKIIFDIYTHQSYSLHL